MSDSARPARASPPPDKFQPASASAFSHSSTLPTLSCCLIITDHSLTLTFCNHADTQRQLYLTFSFDHYYVLLFYILCVITTRLPAIVGIILHPYCHYPHPPCRTSLSLRDLGSVRGAVPVVSCNTWCQCREVLDNVRRVPHSIVVVRCRSGRYWCWDHSLCLHHNDCRNCRVRPCG